MRATKIETPRRMNRSKIKKLRQLMTRLSNVSRALQAQERYLLLFLHLQKHVSFPLLFSSNAESHRHQHSRLVQFL